MSEINPASPLVSFVVVAYNQEEFIREAVAGAFDQTYRPLEIILSDDCSTDRTFEIMKEMAAAYEGPHSVRLVQTHANMGVLRHVLLRGREARGSIVVLAAGDDISVPRRVERHVPAYDDAEALAVTTAYRLIDASGNVVDEFVESHALARKLESYFTATRHPYQVIQGSTSSYRKRVFDLDIPEDVRASEDNWLNFVIYLVGGRVAFIREALVSYRTHSANMANRSAAGCSEAEEAASLGGFEAELSKLKGFRDMKDICASGVRIDFESIARQEREMKEMLSWKDRGVFQRIGSCFAEALRGNVALTRWKTLRLVGAFPRYQPRLVLRSLRRHRG